MRRRYFQVSGYFSMFCSGQYELLYHGQRQQNVSKIVCLLVILVKMCVHKHQLWHSLNGIK